MSRAVWNGSRSVCKISTSVALVAGGALINQVAQTMANAHFYGYNRNSYLADESYKAAVAVWPEFKQDSFGAGRRAVWGSVLRQTRNQIKMLKMTGKKRSAPRVKSA